MEQQPYPRPETSPLGVYPPDKTWGIVIIVLSALGLCLSLALGGLGAALGAGGASMAAQSGANAGSEAAAAGLTGGFVAIIGFALAVSSALQLAGGIGILKSRRWGFLLTGILAVISILLSLSHFNIISIAINGVFIYFCAMRLTGKMGPTPV